MDLLERTEADEGAGPNGPAHVVIVDADENCRRMYSSMLAHRGHRVETTPDCAAAIKAVRSSSTEVIVIDPIECDRAQLAELRQLAVARGIPLVALTSRVTQPELDAIREDGYRVVLLKPVLPSHVADAVEQAIGPGGDGGGS